MTYGWPGGENYRFGRPDQRILIWSGEGQADGFLGAITAESLKQLAQDVWDLGGLSRSLYGYDDKTTQILEQLRT